MPPILHYVNISVRVILRYDVYYVLGSGECLILAGVFYIEVYGNNACFLTLRSELYYRVIYLNGTSMNIEQKTLVRQVESRS